MPYYAETDCSCPLIKSLYRNPTLTSQKQLLSSKTSFTVVERSGMKLCLTSNQNKNTKGK
jgi:hypothetical protein